MLDHLVYAVPDLQAAVRDLGDRLGLSPAPGGQHVGAGTRNYLLGLGEGSYLEIIGVDPDQPEPASPRPFGLDELREARLVTWAERVDAIEQHVERAMSRGYDPGPIRSMSRARPDGVLLTWKLTSSGSSEVPQLVPFLIDWSDTPHPSRGPIPQARLVELYGESPDPESVLQRLAALDVRLDVRPGPDAALVATIAGPRGSVTLR